MITTSAVPVSPPTSNDLLTIRQFAERFPAFSGAALRALIYDSKPRVQIVAGRKISAPANGFAPAFLRVGRRILVDVPRFFEIIRERNGSEKKRGAK